MKKPIFYLRVTDAAELRRFIISYKRASGNELPESYVRKALCFQFYLGLTPVGGFILNTAEMTDLRYLSYLEPSVRKMVLQNEGIQATDILEITAAYMTPGLSQRHKLFYYRVLIFVAYSHCRRLRKTYLCGGSVIRKLQVIQQGLMPRVIYYGTVRNTTQTRIKQPGLLKIYLVENRKVPLRAILLLINRFLVKNTVLSLGNSATRWIQRWRTPSAFSPDATGRTVLGS